MIRKQIHSQHKKTEQVLPEIETETNELHELELAKMQSLQSLQHAFRKSLDFMPVTFFVFVFIIAFFAWWSSFQ